MRGFDPALKQKTSKVWNKILAWWDNWRPDAESASDEEIVNQVLQETHWTVELN